MNTREFTYWTPRVDNADDPMFRAMEDGAAQFWATVGTDWDRWSIRNRRVIGAETNDGRRGYVVTIEAVRS